MIKVVYYARVSTEDEKQINALKIQIEEIEDVIENHSDWVLVDRYIDEGISGTFLDKRDEFKRLIEDLHTDKFDIIVVKDMTRVGRDSYEFGYFLSPLIRNNKKLFFYLDNKFFKPEEELFNAVKYGMAAQFSRDLSQKINGSQKKRMEKGRVITNGRMWGYDQKDGQLFINEKEAEIVRFIFAEYVNGIGFRRIKTKLDERGVTNQNGTLFSMSTLKRIIRNEKYKGVLIMGKRHKDYNTKKSHDVPESEWVIHYDKIPPIISTEQWEIANKELEKKRRSTGSDEKSKVAGYFSGTYVYSSKIKCGKCGRPYYHSTYSRKKDKINKTKLWECKGYREYGKRSENGCDNTRIYDYEMDGIIKQSIFEFWQNKDQNIKNVIEALEEVLLDNQYLDSIDKLNQNEIRLGKKKDKLIELYSDDLISKDEFKKRNVEYNLLLEKVQEEIQELEDKNKNLVSKKERLLKSQSILQTKLNDKDEITDDIIEDFLKEVIVYPDHIEITLDGNYQFVAKKEADKKYYVHPSVTYTRSI
ncbi:MAG: hypothetical protein APF81_17660 [Desulfosporosinus sp. BRH_c37]|nr:MAG: hypothetical protein APF81_17660 [Desulfosporosinus sp. BRH_c37]